jgi:hypothetical protein
MERERPMPDIVLLPEEREEAAAAKVPKLPGAPERAYESALLAEAEGLPSGAFDSVGKDLDRFADARQMERKRLVQRERLRQFLRDPDSFEQYFDTLHILDDRWEDHRYDLTAFKQSFGENFERYIGEINEYTPESLRKWLELSVQSNVYREQAEKVMRTLYERVRNPKETIDFLYAFAQSILETDRKEVFDRGLEILCWGTDVFPRSSRGQKNYLKAAFGGEDDLLQKQQEIDAVVYIFGQKYAPEAYQQMREAMDVLGEDPEVRGVLENLMRKDPGKGNKLIAFLTREERGSGKMVSVPEPLQQEWPYTLALKAGPVRRLFNERIEQEEEQFVNFSLPEAGNLLFRSPISRETILTSLSKESSGERSFSEASYIKALFYLTPELTPEQMEKLAEDNGKLRQDIFRDLTHSISQRGDRMLVVDPELKQLGFKSILFEFSDPSTTTKITVEVGNYQFIVRMDEDLSLVEYGTGRNFPVSFQRRAFFEHILLAHLYALECTKYVSPGSSEAGSDTERLEREEEFRGRRAHLRKLPVGQGFSEQARILGLQDPRRYDLVRRNAELGFTRETGQKTYVSPAPEVSTGREPLISRAPRAMERYRRLLRQEGEQDA